MHCPTQEFEGKIKAEAKTPSSLFSRRETPTCRPIPACNQINLVYFLGESVFFSWFLLSLKPNKLEREQKPEP